jgi:hypothetical protein
MKGLTRSMRARSTRQRRRLTVPTPTTATRKNSAAHTDELAPAWGASGRTNAADKRHPATVLRGALVQHGLRDGTCFLAFSLTRHLMH